MPLLTLPAAILGSAVIGGVVASKASKDAAKAQTNLGQQAISEQRQMNDLIRGDLMPYNVAGQAASADLMGRLGDLNRSFAPDKDWLETTPGYKFTLDQGLKAVQNSASARGLGISGAAQKGAARFATGLADSTWQTQFNADQAQRQNIYNRLMGVVQSGQNAAAQAGSYGTQAAQGIGQTLQGIGNAQASGIVGSANAISGIGPNIISGMLTNKLLGMYGASPTMPTGGSSQLAGLY